MKVVVLHEGYGCDTGCCGHIVETVDGEQIGGFDFSHPYGENAKEWAIEFARDAVEAKYGTGHAFDLDWENCTVSDS